MTDKIFVDSNIWVYLFADADDLKSNLAHDFVFSTMQSGGSIVVSFQVINEVSHVLKRKKYTEAEIRRVIGDMMGFCLVSDFSRASLLLASDIRDKHSFSFWDSQIIASALLSDCSILASEDMQDGMVLSDMVIKNVLKA